MGETIYEIGTDIQIVGNFLDCHPAVIGHECAIPPISTENYRYEHTAVDLMSQFATLCYRLSCPARKRPPLLRGSPIVNPPPSTFSSLRPGISGHKASAPKATAKQPTTLPPSRHYAAAKQPLSYKYGLSCHSRTYFAVSYHVPSGPEQHSKYTKSTSKLLGGSHRGTPLLANRSPRSSNPVKTWCSNSTAAS